MEKVCWLNTSPFWSLKCSANKKERTLPFLSDIINAYQMWLDVILLGLTKKCFSCLEKSFLNTVGYFAK